MKTLIIVDVQKDFYDPSGSLYVKGGEEIIDKIKKLILSDFQINQVIFTVDWHTSEDYSFKKNGGIWPIHCLQHSSGASLPSELIDACIYRGFQTIDGSYYKNNESSINKFFLSNTYDIFEKGEIPGEEEYGAFLESEGLEEDESIVMMTGISGDSCAYLNIENDIILCGLAGDYCVLETAKNLESILSEQPGETGDLLIWLPGIKSIDGGKKLNDWMKKSDIKEYKYEV